jgi:hypothetical protein
MSSLAALMERTDAAHPGADLAPVRAGYETARRRHTGQFRKSGEPYITHPVAVATILAELGQDIPTLVAALLHDTVTDTGYPLTRIREEFGPDVASLLDAFLRLERLGAGYAVRDQAAAAAVSATLLVSVIDPRVLTIKLADRLHNMRTVGYLPAPRRREKARQTLTVIAPMARQLGLHGLRRELEDLSRAALPETGQAHRSTVAARRALELATLALPAPARLRFREQWANDLAALPTRQARVRFALRALGGLPRLAWLLRPARGTTRWTVSLSRIARALGIGSAVVVVTAPGPVVAWVAGGVAGIALLLLTALLFARRDTPVDRLIRLIRAWRH